MTASDRGSVASENAYAAVRPGGPAAGAPAAPSYPQAHTPSVPATLSPSTSAAPLSPIQQQRTAGGDSGLDGFDRANFDPSQPASWEALGKAWTTTHGTMPTQEELMQFAFGGGAPTPTAPPLADGMPASATQQAPHISSSSQQSPPQTQRFPPPQYGSDESQWQGQDRHWDRQPQDQRGGWRGRPGGDGGYGGGLGRGRGRGRGRGDFGRGGHGRGDHGWGGGFGREEHGRGDYGYGNGRGAYSAGGRGGGGFQEQETDAVMLGGGDDFEWQGEREPRGPSYGQQQPAFQGQNSYQTQPAYQNQPPYQGQPPFQSQPQGPPETYDTAASPGRPNDVGEGGGGGPGGRMQKVGDKWVFVRNTV
ncbi:hypothetical protein C8Q79DRAFT_241287 [Trametes meyenii]|nr:hypothetical protein C8Q79DRAFT_241287 [Trametes meyenii]